MGGLFGSRQEGVNSVKECQERDVCVRDRGRVTAESPGAGEEDQAENE